MKKGKHKKIEEEVLLLFTIEREKCNQSHQKRDITLPEAVILSKMKGKIDFQYYISNFGNILYIYVLKEVF